MSKIHQCQCSICTEAGDQPEKILHHRLNVLLSRLDAQQRRWYVALEAEKLGHGGITLMTKITGLHPETIRRGQKELVNDLADRPVERVRLPGGGRPSLEKKRPSLDQVIEKLIENDTAGDPMSEKKWVRCTVRQMSQALQKQGYGLSRSTVWRWLKKLNYGLHANRKRFTGSPHPKRDQQMRYIGRVKQLFLAAGHPVIRVDTKKKEQIGNFKNPGRRWGRQPEEVNAHDFARAARAKAIPYGLYDLLHNEGYVYVGTSADTAELAVEALVRWWTDPDRPRFRDESKLLILGDADGSNSYRSRLWKQQLQARLADQLGVEVMVCHYPTGASKWNPIEHRLFSYISLNWAGKPLRTLETMLGYIRDTTTETGLKVKAFLLQREFEKGIKVPDEVMEALNVVPRRICPYWNYIISPSATSST